ncbi:MAG TPA: zf-HC2 domain-containing protein [Candidatus Atribacteria bacterium]|nr:zf-HC2 domain-containing protein [Candidatus Atribacteria bacterium]
MNCERTKKMLSAYLDKELNAEEYRLLKEHLMCCPGCQKELNQLRALKNVTRCLGDNFNYHCDIKLDWENIEKKTKLLTKKKVVCFSLAAIIAVLVLFLTFSQEWAKWEVEVIHPEALVDLHQSLSGNQLDVSTKKEANFIGTLELVSGGK